MIIPRYLCRLHVAVVGYLFDQASWGVVLRCAQKKRYRVGGSYQWVVCGLQRTCWIPAGYVGRRKSWCRVGSTRITAGKNGVLRELAFGELPSMEDGVYCCLLATPAQHAPPQPS